MINTNRIFAAITLLLLVFVASCRNPVRWENPPTGIPTHPSGVPEMSSGAPPSKADQPDLSDYVLDEDAPDADVNSQ